MVTEGLNAFKAKYDARFASVFPADSSTSASQIEFSKAITSNLMGGIGYFYGTSIVDRSGSSDDEEDEGFESEAQRKARGRPELAEATELTTATPSRSFFPRGFYWFAYTHTIKI